MTTMAPVSPAYYPPKFMCKQNLEVEVKLIGRLQCRMSSCDGFLIKTSVTRLERV
jgi:hypothetical protein